MTIFGPIHSACRHLIHFAVFILLLPSLLTAQAAYLEDIGPPQPRSTMPVELGSINLANGNLHFEVPLGTYPQRGQMPFEAKLVYDSRIWVAGDYGPALNQLSFRPFNLMPTHPQAGWRLQVSNDPNFNQPGYLGDTVQCPFDNFVNGQSYTTFSGFFWTEPNGATHTFSGLQTTQTFGTPNCNADSPTAGGYADDGSGLFMAINNFTDVTIYGTDGKLLVSYSAQNDGTIPPYGEDSNGNYFSLDASGNPIDTLGRTPIVTTVSGNNTFYDVLNAQGTRSRYTVTTETIPVSVPNYSTTLTVIQSITLPNNTSYQFGYDSGTSGNNWGLINSVTLPTGGQITYGYTTFEDASGNALNTNRWVSSRTTPDGTWSYTPQVIQLQTSQVGCPNNSAQQKVTVANPDGSSMVYKLTLANQSSETDYFATGGTLLKQEFVTYNDGECSAPTGGPLGNVALPVSASSNTFGSTGTSISTKETYDYTNAPSVENPTKISQWNYYTGTPSATPDRIRQITYSLTNPTLAGAHIIAKPLSVTLSDGAGTTQIAQTSFTYDNYTQNPLASTDACQSTTASQLPPAAPQHDYKSYCTSNVVRGNVTQVSKWLNTTGISITTTTNTFDDTGNLVKTKDALSNLTSIGYSSSFGLAYPTTITNAKNQVTTANYDFNTGLPISETDPNNAIKKYSYDGMGRLIQTDFPDGGQTKVNFNNDAIPLTITTTQLATPDPSIVGYTVMDGLGRKQNECLTDPEGDDCVETHYDVNGRVLSKSNPHRTTAAASDGVNTFAYDGLDRPTSATEQDHNIASVAYDTQSTPIAGEVSITADETGRQRRTVTDAFGRVVEEDEPGDSSPGKQAYVSVDIGGIKTTIIGGSSAKQATGSITISGNEKSVTYPGERYCAAFAGTRCVDWEFTDPTIVNDSGTVTVYVNGQAFSYRYGASDSVSTIGNSLAGSIRTSSSSTDYSSVAVNTGTNPPTATIYLVARNAGGAGNNITLSFVPTAYDTTDFTSASFSPSIAGPNLTGGADAVPGTPVTDHGTVTMTVATFTTTSVSYGPGTANTNGAQVATALANALTGSGFSGSTNGSTVITVTDNSFGAAGNGISVTVQPSSSDPGDFPSPSFSVSPVSLANGQDSYPSGLAHPYVTRYFYDLLDNLTCIEQHGNAAGSDCSPYVMPITASAPPAADSSSPWRIRRFAYDSLSRLRWSNDPESGLTSISYDNNGNRISETDAREVTINYSPAASPIDALNRVTMITYSDGTPTMTYGYDQGCCGITPLNAIGRLTYANGGNTELIFSYDPMGRTKIQWDCPPSGIARNQCYVLSAGYDLAGQMTSLTYPDGRTVTDGYSAAGRMTRITLQNFGSTAVNVPYYTVPQSTLPSAWGYWPTGTMNRGTFGNGIVETTGYNPRLQMNTISDAKGTVTLMNRSYGLYDSASHNNGNILSIADLLNSSKSQSYSYDSLNRISGGSQVDSSFNVTYSYDPWGNMTQSGTSNFSPTYDLHNRIQPAPAGCTSSTLYCYDAAGNLLNDGSHAYSYDGESRLKTVDSTSATYTYNPAGHRVRKDTTTGSTEYFYLGDNMVSELNPISGAWTDYIYGYGKRIAKDTSTTATAAQYFQNDQIGSTRMVTDSAGNIFWQAGYNAFGQELSQQNTTITFQFAGMQYDSESNLNHTDFRQYASAEARWLTPDPYLGSIKLENPQSLNRYSYVLNNPLTLRDPQGLDCIYDADAAKDAGLPGPGIIRGDCLSDTDGGRFVDGTITNVTYLPSGDLSYSAKGNDQVGVIADFYTNDTWSPDAMIDATRMKQQTARKRDDSDLLSPNALLIFTLVGHQTGEQTKQVDCAAGFIYPFIPGVKPEDISDILLDEGLDHGSDALGDKAEGVEETAKKLARTKKKGTALAARQAMRKSKMLKGGSYLLKGVNYYLNFKQGVKNWRDCEAGKDPE